MTNVYASSFRNNSQIQALSCLAKFAFLVPLGISACGKSNRSNGSDARANDPKSTAESGKTENSKVKAKPRPGQIHPSNSLASTSSATDGPLSPQGKPTATAGALIQDQAQDQAQDQDQAQLNRDSGSPGNGDASKQPLAPEKRSQNEKNKDKNSNAKNRAKTDQDSRPPKCVHQGSRSEGWQAADGRPINKTKCKGIEPRCLYSGTRSEGWYANKELIEYSRCTRPLTQKPICVNSGTRSEAWKWPDGTFIEYAPCKGQQPECKHVGSKSEGWYYSGDKLIIYVRCTPGTP